MTLEDYVAFCAANPKLRCERTAEGKVTLLGAVGGDGSYRSGTVSAELSRWADTNGGYAFGSNAQFILPDGSALLPDASWVSHANLHTLTYEQRREFLRLVPEFVVEVMCPSDRLKPAKAKMEQWIANGVQLAWLIDGDHETVYVYRKGRNAETRRGIQEITGEGPVKGFTLKLQEIWRGLS